MRGDAKIAGSDSRPIKSQHDIGLRRARESDALSTSTIEKLHKVLT